MTHWEPSGSADKQAHANVKKSQQQLQALACFNCYVKLCNVMLYYVNVTLFWATLCHAALYYAILCCYIIE